MPTVKLQSNDDVVIETDSELLKCSNTLTCMLEDCYEDENAVVPLPRVNAYILRKVLLWAEYHKHDPPQLVDDVRHDDKEKSTDDIGPWDTEFLKVDQATLFQLILAANYLDIQPLLNLTCKSVANIIKGKTPEQIRRTFNIINDFTPEEAEQVDRENGWCESSK